MTSNKTRIIQITDTHLFNSADGNLMGIRTRESLDAVIQLIQTKCNDFACLLVTGDISQDDSPASYEYLKEALLPLQKPFFWLCGNHDAPEEMALVAPEAMKKQVTVGNWQILLLNSQVSGAVYGHLASIELQFLEAQLAETPDKHTLLAIHHHPCSIQSEWMDKIGIDNATSLENIIRQNQQVKCIIHGHVHQDRQYSIANTPVLATPSTCLQFAPLSKDFKASLSQPGFRILDLLPDGRFETQVIRLEGFPIALDMDANGY